MAEPVAGGRVPAPLRSGRQPHSQQRCRPAPLDQLTRTPAQLEPPGPPRRLATLVHVKAADPRR